MEIPHADLARQQSPRYPHPLAIAEQQSGEQLNHLYDVLERAIATSFRIVFSPWFLIGSALAGAISILADSLDRDAG